VLALVVDVEVDELGLFGEDGRLAEVEAEVELGAHDQDQVRAAQGRPPCPRKQQRMAGRQHAASHAVDAQRQVGVLDELPQLLLRVRPPHAAARDDGRASRLADQLGGALDGLVIGRRATVDRQVLGGLREISGPEEDVDRNIHEHRARAAAQGHPHALGRARVGVVGGLERHRLLGHALHHRDVVHLLQRAHPPPGGRCAAADDEHGAIARLRLGQRGHRVGHAGTGRHRRHTAFARDLGPPFGRKSRRLLMPHVDDVDAVLDGAGEDRPDVAAVQGEEVADSRTLEGKRDQLSCVAGITQRASPMAWRVC
jgi:hypothetical protein